MSRLGIASETGLPLISLQPTSCSTYSLDCPEQRVRFDSVLRLAGAPRGVAGRNSDNTFIGKVLDQKPDTPLDKGLAITCKWIKSGTTTAKKSRRVME